MKFPVVATFALLACGAERPVAEAPSAATLAIASVCPGGVLPDRDAPAPRDPTAKWPAARFAGALFSTANARGYLASVRITKQTRECDHCFGPSVEVELIDGTWWDEGSCELAVGPLERPLPKMRVLEMNRAGPTHAVTPWRDWVQIDLDGDGRSDLSGVERCERVTPSSCGEHLCNRTCQGVRAASAPESDVRLIECSEHIPDTVDKECP